ncbi:hypothetical protein [Paracoccus sp. ME4]|uniref:hypothetical protein n=1 Tax=Paracoccus sp. ME4 TaxID=3138066 RepID=UPI00398A9016
MSGLSKEQLDAIEAEVAGRPEDMEELIDMVMELRGDLDRTTEEVYAANTELALLKKKLQQAGIAV